MANRRIIQLLAASALDVDRLGASADIPCGLGELILTRLHRLAGPIARWKVFVSRIPRASVLSPIGNLVVGWLCGRRETGGPHGVFKRTGGHGWALLQHF